jgi:hypothetical protein
LTIQIRCDSATTVVERTRVIWHPKHVCKDEPKCGLGSPDRPTRIEGDRYELRSMISRPILPVTTTTISPTKLMTPITAKKT